MSKIALGAFTAALWLALSYVAHGGLAAVL